MYAVEKAGARGDQFDWSHFVLSSLRRHVVYIHSSADSVRQLRGAPVIDAILSSWFSEPKEVIEPRPIPSNVIIRNGGHKGTPVSFIPPDHLARHRLRDRTTGNQREATVSATAKPAATPIRNRVPAQDSYRHLLTIATSTAESSSSHLHRRRLHLSMVSITNLVRH